MPAAGLGAAVVSFLAALGITLAPDAQTELKIVVDALVAAIIALSTFLSHIRQKHAVEVNAALTAKHLVVQQKQAEASIAASTVTLQQNVAAGTTAVQPTGDGTLSARPPDAGPPEPLVVTSDPAAGAPVTPVEPPF